MSFTFTPLETPVPIALVMTQKSSNSEILSCNIILTLCPELPALSLLNHLLFDLIKTSLDLSLSYFP